MLVVFYMIVGCWMLPHKCGVRQIAGKEKVVIFIIRIFIIPLIIITIIIMMTSSPFGRHYHHLSCHHLAMV